MFLTRESKLGTAYSYLFLLMKTIVFALVSRDEPKWEFAHLPLQVKVLDQLVNII